MRKFFGFIVITALVCLASSCNKDTLDSSGAALGKFSVAPGKQVYFSRGNLQANVFTLKFRFAPKQYEAWGRYAFIYETITYTDMFGWSTAGSRYGTCYAYNTDCGGHTTPDYSGSFVDWGGNSGKKWRTLSIEEWEYLFSHDTHSNSTRDGLYAYNVTVVGVEGCVILYPDKYKGKKVKDNDKNSYNSEEDWLKAEKKGVICLPPTGCILEDGRTLGLEGGEGVGDYWSSSSYDSTQAHALVFNSFHGPFPRNQAGKTWYGRSIGMAVRLVWDVNGTLPDHSPYEPPKTPETPDTPVTVNNCCFVNVENLEVVGSQYVVGKDEYGVRLVAYDKDLKKVKPISSQNLTVEFLDGAGSYFSYSSSAASTYGYDGLYYCFKAKPTTPEGTKGKVRLSYNDGKIKFESTIQLVLPVLAHNCCFVNVEDCQPVADEYIVNKDSQGIGIVAYDMDQKKVLATDDQNLKIEFLGGASTYFSSESVSAGSYSYKGNYYSFKAKTAAPDGQTGYVALTYDDGINKIEKTLKLFYPGPLDKFSVSSSKKVYFPTTGNVLMMCPNAKPEDTSDIWSTAPHQYDSGTWPAGTGQVCIRIGSWSGTDCVPKADWASKVGDSSLRVLSIDEWHYLVSYGNKKNSTREGLVAYGVTVAGVPNCVIIYPDGYKGKIVKDGDTTTYNDVSEWEAADKEHVVCLPVWSSDVYGTYWSSSTSGSKTYVFHWVKDTPYGNGVTQLNNSERACVRLVRDVK